MPEEDGAPTASRSETRKNPSGRNLLWISSLALGFCLLGVAFVALTNQAVNWSSSDNFCGTACHSMTWAVAAYHEGSHYTNNVGVRASCGDCHIPYDSGHATAVQYVTMLLFKADRGGKDIWYEINRSIATKEEWDKRRPALSNTFESYLKQHNYITCRGCHSLESFGGQRSHMKLVIHQGLVTADSYDCLQCHANIGHVYDQPSSMQTSSMQTSPKQTPPKLSGWYSVEQAVAGKELFEKSCSGCHGEKLEGISGPALTGAAWKQSFGGAKLLTVWGEIKGPMAGYAGVTFTTQQSLDILAYLLQQNGLAAGNQPLADTRMLSDTLP
jgi:nitrate/TMAO reductase-like tetraheme cytochrome c subunit/mono/diheme cytochrome c family protein